MGPFECICDLQAGLLESPVWDERRNLLFFCDVESMQIFATRLDGKITGQWRFPSPVGSLGLAESGALVVALARKVVRFEPETEKETTLWEGFDEPATSRLNDGKVGPDGAFWVGGMNSLPQRQKISRLYRITADGRAQVMAEGMVMSNGLAWSADASTMYHSDSHGPWINRYDFDMETGEMSNCRRLATLDEARGRPDGGACDMAGNYWSAGVSAGVLNRFAPDGSILEVIAAPVPAPTMPCFCGPDLKMFAITSHRLLPDEVVARAPQAGGLFLAKADVAGVPVHRMKDV